MNAAEPFNQWVLWNGDGTQDFICIEPMSGAVNALNSGVGLVQLQPGEAKDLHRPAVPLAAVTAQKKN